jgi:tRNA-binding protein
MATFKDFEKLDIRVGKVVGVDDFSEAKKPSYKLTIDFGSELGIKKSAAQLVDLYSKEKLKDKLILAVVNFSPKQIGPFISEVLILGVPDKGGNCALVVPDKRSAKIGGRLY